MLMFKSTESKNSTVITSHKEQESNSFFCDFRRRSEGSIMFAVRNALRLASRISLPAVSRRGCAGAAVPVDDIVNGLTDEQIQVSHTR